MTYTLPILPYPYDEFEPFFDEKTMKIHHMKHHQTYINNTNTILKKLNQNYNNLPIETLIKQLKNFPKKEQIILKNNAGGHINHTLFWKFLKKNTILTGTLKDAIEYHFNNVENFKKHFEQCAMNRFGSGWIWVVKKDNNILEIISTANQDNPLMGKEVSGKEYSYPILGLDVWEHAYYLKYQNNRINYVKSFWNIVNWDEVSQRFTNPSTND